MGAIESVFYCPNLYSLGAIVRISRSSPLGSPQAPCSGRNSPGNRAISADSAPPRRYREARAARARPAPAGQGPAGSACAASALRTDAAGSGARRAERVPPRRPRARQLAGGAGCVPSRRSDGWRRRLAAWHEGERRAAARSQGPAAEGQRRGTQATRRADQSEAAHAASDASIRSSSRPYRPADDEVAALPLASSPLVRRRRQGLGGQRPAGGELPVGSAMTRACDRASTQPSRPVEPRVPRCDARRWRRRRPDASSIKPRRVDRTQTCQTCQATEPTEKSSENRGAVTIFRKKSRLRRGYLADSLASGRSSDTLSSDPCRTSML